VHRRSRGRRNRRRRRRQMQFTGGDFSGLQRHRQQARLDVQAAATDAAHGNRAQGARELHVPARRDCSHLQVSLIRPPAYSIVRNILTSS